MCELVLSQLHSFDLLGNNWTGLDWTELDMNRPAPNHLNSPLFFITTYDVYSLVPKLTNWKINSIILAPWKLWRRLLFFKQLAFFANVVKSFVHYWVFSLEKSSDDENLIYISIHVCPSTIIRNRCNEIEYIFQNKPEIHDERAERSRK